MRRTYGGNPPLPATLLAGAPSGASVAWLASGRDGYALVCGEAPSRPWLLPEFICGVVPRVLRGLGAHVLPYRAGALADVPLKERRRSTVVLMWDVDRGPSRGDAVAARDAPLIVQDRCVWAGMPWHLGAIPGRHVVIGSCRKWLGTGDGGWVAGIRGRHRPFESPDPVQAASAAAAALLRRLRGLHELPSLESANLATVELAEHSLGIPRRARAMSELAGALLAASGRLDHARRTRARLAGRITALLGGSDHPRIGAIGVRIVSGKRDALRAALARSDVFAAVHWPDGAWTRAAAARRFSATTMTIPAPEDLAAADERAYLRLLGPILRRHGARLARLGELA